MLVRTIVGNSSITVSTIVDVEVIDVVEEDVSVNVMTVTVAVCGLMVLKVVRVMVWSSSMTVRRRAEQSERREASDGFLPAVEIATAL